MLLSKQASGETYTFEGVAADESRVHYSFTTNLEGKAVPISGMSVPGGGDAVATTRVSPNADTTIMATGGQVVGRLRVVVSKNGKVTTHSREGTDASGKPITQVVIWESSSRIECAAKQIEDAIRDQEENFAYSAMM